MGERMKQIFLENTMSHRWKDEITLIQINNFPNLQRKISHKKTIYCKEDCKIHCNSSNHGLITFERAVRRNQLRKYRMLFDQSHDSFLLIDLKGRILEANTAALEAYGYTREELCKRKIHDLRVVETRSLVNQQIHKAYDQGIVFETYHVRKNGECFPVEVRSFRFETILLSCIQDITHRKQSQMDALKKESIKAVGKVAAGLAHEIRNSITGVHGFLQLAASRGITLERFAENVDFMIQELNYANLIISDLILLDYNRKLNLELKSLNHIILALFPSIQKKAKLQGSTVKIQLTKLPYILLDEKEIRKLVNNLVNNSLESIENQEGVILIKTHIDQHTLSLSIKDNGSGINPENLDQLGTPFFTTKNTGIGLGLVVCKSIVKRHNAALKIDSNHWGTTVQVTFDI